MTRRMDGWMDGSRDEKASRQMTRMSFIYVIVNNLLGTMEKVNFSITRLGGRQGG
jgi:hypothetical protein